MDTADREPVALADIIAKMRGRKFSAERDEVAHIAGRQAFLDALQTYPIDNRRVGETWRDAFTKGETCKPSPPRSEFLAFQRGSREGVVSYTLDMLESDYPQHFREYGEQKAAVFISDRLDDMEKARKEGRAVEKKGGARKTEGWNLG